MFDKKLLKQQFNLFLKSKGLIVILLLLLFGTVITAVFQLFSNVSYEGILTALNMPLSFSIFSYLVFALLSFDMSHKIKRNNMDECFNAIKNGYLKLCISQFIVFLFIIALYFVIINLWTFFLYIKYSIFDGKLILQILLNSFLSFFLVPCLATIMGMALTMISGRLNGCILIIIFVLLGSPYINNIGAMVLEITNKNIYPIINLFDIFPPSLNWKSVYAFGQTILPYRWELTLLWMFLFLSIIAIRLFKKKQVMSFACPAICLICLVLVMTPSSKLLLASDDPVNSIMADEQYYSLNSNDAIFEDADFEVENYDLNITVKNKLFVNATLTLTRRDLSEYKFTLYHGFKIKSVKNDSGDDLAFLQDEDNFVVYNEGQNINKITITYSGYSPIFYSNIQGAFLPGYFPYYPHSGFKPVYDIDSHGINQFVLNKPTTFNLKISSNQKIYCNLENVNKNEYCGATTGLTIVSGMYDDANINGLKIIYPYLDASITLDNLKSFYNSYFDSNALPNNIKTVFVVPDVNNISPYTAYCQFSDSLDTISILYLDVSYEAQNIESYKRALYSAYQKYISDPESIRNFINERKKFFKEQFPETDLEEIYTPVAEDYLIEYLDNYGEKQGLDKLSEYFQDENDKRHWKEFVTQF